MKFTELQLHPDLQRGIEDAGYVDCMPVQEQVLKNAFGGNDLYVQSQTGTGKTAAYLVAIFQRLLSDSTLGGRKALIMVPTRELAVQVEDEAKKLGKYLPFKVGSFYGGVGYAHQQKLLRENAQIMVGTPGRVLDLNSSGQMSLMDLSFLVLDEADRMFDMGFYPDLRKLIKVIPPAERRQTMLFSATLNAWVKNLAWEYTKEPLEIEIEPENVTVEEIEQLLYHVPSHDKMKALLGIFEREKPESAIIFCNTKRYTEIVAKRLRMNGIECEFIIGDLPQFKRLQIIEDVKSGKTRFLVATDVAARGLDVEGLALVVNYDMPNETENYVHRIGRTARAGKTGKAYSLASEQDVYGLPAIEKYLGQKIPSEVMIEAMYGEDKSDGLRIHVDSYGDDSRDSRGGRDSRDGGRGRRDGGRGRDSRDSRGGRDSRPRATEGRGRGGEHPTPQSGERRFEDRPRADPYAGEAAPYGDAAASGAPDSGAPRSERSRRPDTRRSGERVAEGARREARDDRPRRDDRSRQAPRDNRAAAKSDISRLPLEERMAYYRKKYGEDFQPDAADRGNAPRGQGQAGKGSSGKGRGNAPRGQGAARPASGQKPAAGKPAAAPQEAKKSILGRILGLFGRKGN